MTLIGAGVAAGVALVGADLANSAAPASAWGGYANGKIPLSELTQVGGYYFRNDAAQAMNALRSAYSAALGRTLIINDGYRDLAGQQQAWNDYQNGGNLAAPPGTSNHGWALAVDFGGEVYSSSSSAGHQWLQANAQGFGWWWAGRFFSQVENWHWEFSGSYTPQNPSTSTPIGLDMTFLCITPINGSNADAGIYRWVMDPAAGTKRNIDAAEYDFLKAVGYRELGGLQSPAVSYRYQQIHPSPTQP
ncbi:D-alanyl-D-alanine carboxypeptidase family protein [Microbacterium sp. MYb64]|uniref:M15 family metallopeptidase n=1 Tax=Microbacterium sp. MYb64 TaxID=1848691 RepID=UPI0015E3A1B4|nr:M15 family metallopeptidase [Microbacterium sp. MYb64]